MSEQIDTCYHPVVVEARTKILQLVSAVDKLLRQMSLKEKLSRNVKADLVFSWFIS